MPVQTKHGFSPFTASFTPMAKLHKNPPRGVDSRTTTSFSSYSGHPTSTGSNGWDIWHPAANSSSRGSIRGDTRSTTSAQLPASFVSRTMSYAQSQLDAVTNYGSGSSYSKTGADQVVRRPVVGTGNSNSTAYTPPLRSQSPAYSNHASQSHSPTPYNSTYSSGYKSEYVPAPKTESERYWAYRAIVAEVKLAERMGVRSGEVERMKEELRRHSAGSTRHPYYEEHVLKLERLAIGLISTIILITLILLFRHSSEDKSSNSKHRTFRPHLTIPILSPFTSIVEHEDSKFGFRTTAAFLVVFGCVVYAMFRHWLRQRPR